MPWSYFLQKICSFLFLTGLTGSCGFSISKIVCICKFSFLDKCNPSNFTKFSDVMVPEHRFRVFYSSCTYLAVP